MVEETLAAAATSDCVSHRPSSRLSTVQRVPRRRRPRVTVSGRYSDRPRRRLLPRSPRLISLEAGLQFENAEDVLSGVERRREREALDRFFTALGQDGDVACGAEETRTALDYRAVDVLLVTDARPPAEIRELEAATTDQGGECLVMSTDTDRGAQFDTAFGGLGALLRFRIN